MTQAYYHNVSPRILGVTSLFFTALLAQGGVPKAVLWHDPGAVERLDFVSGPGSPSLRRQPPFRYVREMDARTSPKIEVRDGRGMVWRAECGGEGRCERVASRAAWAWWPYAGPLAL